MSMYFLARKLPISKSLNSQKVAEFTNYLGRYNAITDLAAKSPSQKRIFLNRVQKLFKQKLECIYSSYIDPPLEYLDTSIDLFLLTVFCQSQQNFSLESFPLYDFIGFNIIRDGKLIKSSYGVMYSAYTHDMDRGNIENKLSFQYPIELSLLLMQSLFQPTCINENLPPLSEKYPIFVFPQDLKMIGVPPATNRYMEKLEFQVSIQEDLEGSPLRLFSHRLDVQTFEDSEIMSAIFAVGQVVLEMIYPHLYHAGINEDPSGQCRFLARSPLEIFNRNNFTNSVKENQAEVMRNWLRKNSERFPIASELIYT